MLLHGAYKRSFAESAEEPDSTSGQDGDNYAWARHSPSVTADLPRASTVASGPAQDIRLDDDGNGGSESASWDHAAGAQLTSVVDSNVALDRVNSEALVSTPTGSSKAPTPKNVKRPKYTIPYRRNRNPCVACTVQSVRCEMVDRRPPCTRCCDLDQPCVLKYPGKKPVARPPLRHKMTSSTSQDRRGEVVSQLKSPTTTRVSHDQASATTCTRCRTLGIPCIPTRTPRCVECRDKHTKCSLLVRPLPKTMPPIIDPPLVDPPARGSDDSSEDTSSSSDDISDEASVTSAIKDEPFEDEDCLTSIRVFGHDGIHSRPGDPVARWPQEGPMAEQVESTTRLSNSIVSPNFLHRGSTNPRVVALINQPSFSSNPLCRQEFLDMWAKCRYVKEGLMSAREILDYFHWYDITSKTLSFFFSG